MMIRARREVILKVKLMPDEHYANSPVLNAFIVHVLEVVASNASPQVRVDRMRPAFGNLLAADNWLPVEFTCANPSSKMGGGIASYLIFRREDRSLTLHALVVPPRAETPIHDHLAWGLVGLYRGEQDEEVFRRQDHGIMPGKASLSLIERRALKPGDVYALLPPEGDIHRVRTTSDVPSISIHLLGNDLGCIWRHAYDPQHGTVHGFRSGYANVECKD
jgi:predicted metal-dependent enzyme (double-stranded beta helix superfamily)